MRLTFAATMRDSYDGIASAAERMIKYQRQVSTGIKVAQPSDDPSATATTISEKAAHASYEQYVQAGDSAESVEYTTRCSALWTLAATSLPLGDIAIG